MSRSDPMEMRTFTAASSRFASSLFNYGNITAVLLPIPFGLIWIGLSIMVYAMNRHHPDPKVGYYTQRACYRFYGISGSFVVIASSFPGKALYYYAGSWLVAAVLLVPLSIRELYLIRREHWVDIDVPVPESQ